jgi:hypothetical protein
MASEVQNGHLLSISCNFGSNEIFRQFFLHFACVENGEKLWKKFFHFGWGKKNSGR